MTAAPGTGQLGGSEGKLLLLGVLTGCSSKQGSGKALDGSVEIAGAALWSLLLEVAGRGGCAGRHPPAPRESAQAGPCRRLYF